MPTIPYNQMTRDMIEERPEMAAEMLEDAINRILAGELDDGRLLLRQYVNATLGFQELARRTGKIDRGLMRMLSKDGNPTASNLMEIVRACADAQGVEVIARVFPRGAASAPARLQTH